MTSQLGFSNNMMISDAGNEAISLEVTPVETFWVAPEAGLLVHANHFVAPSARAKVRDLSLLTNTDSLYRDARVRQHLLKAKSKIIDRDPAVGVSGSIRQPARRLSLAVHRRQRSALGKHGRDHCDGYHAA